MIALAIELLGAVLSVVGAITWYRSARGNLRHAALLPVLVYVGGQAISIANTGREDFASVYTWALAVMAIGGVLGIAMTIRAPARSDDDA